METELLERIIVMPVGVGRAQAVCLNGLFGKLETTKLKQSSILLRLYFQDAISKERFSGLTRERSPMIDVDTIVTSANFSTELQHPRLRSSVRRISVPSQTAEVSS
jgi:hypothetical protein